MMAGGRKTRMRERMRDERWVRKEGETRKGGEGSRDFVDTKTNI